ncbi:MAG TPA: hypothetical protein VN048_15210 [Verrucomicrobiae bacterium]|jgi:hypothetical protein|nr:hypothetical protein [Verrucomicrobiae bacterium]
MFGAIVLAAGLTGAAVVYFTVQEPAVSSQPDEALPLLDSKADSRALEENQGKTGVLMVSMGDELARPGPLALVIAVSATVVSLVCFRIADWISSGPGARTVRQNSDDRINR